MQINIYKNISDIFLKAKHNKLVIIPFVASDYKAIVKRNNNLVKTLYSLFTTQISYYD